MNWIVDFLDAYVEWEAGTDPHADADLRLSVLEYIHYWQSDGPPDDGRWEEVGQYYSVDVPGTPVTLQYLVYPSHDPPGIDIIGVRS